MKKKIDNINNVFEFKFPSTNDTIIEMMMDWCVLINKQKKHEDVWTVIPELPQFIFKNVHIVPNPNDKQFDDNGEMTITFQYEDFEPNNNYIKHIKNGTKEM